MWIFPPSFECLRISWSWQRCNKRRKNSNLFSRQYFDIKNFQNISEFIILLSSTFELDWWDDFWSNEMDLPFGVLVEILKQFSMRKKLPLSFWWWMVKFLKWFPTRKKLCIKFLMMDLPSGMLVEFLKWFSMRKKLRIKFLIQNLPSRILVKFLKRFPTRKKLCIEFLNFGWIFEAIFYEKKLLIKFLMMDGFRLWLGQGFVSASRNGLIHLYRIIKRIILFKSGIFTGFSKEWKYPFCHF